MSCCLRNPDALVVHNKIDAAIEPDGPRPAGLAVSALERQGLEPLIAEIVRRLLPEPLPPGAAVPFREEQVEELKQILARLR